jgi:formylglycine-generating enzyme required for sulfatase activity
LDRAIDYSLTFLAMHLETLLYMLLQSEKTVAPLSIKPDFESLAEQAEILSVPNKWHTIPAQDVAIGLTDPENNKGPDRYFGWDNEKPQRTVHVPAFEAMARGITNGEYAQYLKEKGITALPASWAVAEDGVANDKQTNGVHKHIDFDDYNGDVHPNVQPLTNGHSNGHTNGTATTLLRSISPEDPFLIRKTVRTIFGPVPLAHCLTWPVIASYEALSGCAAYMGGRIPTLEEARSIYSFVDQQKSKLIAPQVSGHRIAGVNGQLGSEGVEETPPYKPCVKESGVAVSGTAGNGKLDPRDLFTDLTGLNVAFSSLHPTPVTTSSALKGQSDAGGAWEWTSSVLQPHEGFKAMESYPGYTEDFLDGKHNVMLGGSWATHPRIAGRRSFVNWYQRGYPYAWAGSRVVRDL